MGRVLVTHPMPPGGLDPLAGHEIDQRDGISRDELIKEVAGVDGVVCMLTVPIDAAVLNAGAPRLKVVGNMAVGYDNIDVPAATAAGVRVCNTPGVLDETTADTAFGLIIAAPRLFAHAERELREGRWGGWWWGQYAGMDVHGATLGIVGYGRIGQAVAHRALGFGMTVVHHARHDTGVEGFRASLDDLLRESDIVSIHVPLSDATRHLIGRRELGLMKRTAVLVNTARGPIVDEEALADALESDGIFAAGLDVYDGEPNVNPRLLAAPRTVLLPHIGSASVATRTKMAQAAASGVAAVLAGETPPNLVEP